MLSLSLYLQQDLINSGAGTHPFHRHGAHYQIVSRIKNYTDTSLDQTIQEGQANPMRRDTMNVDGVRLLPLIETLLSN